MMRFSVRSNCVAHGKTKHGKLVVPIVIDITRGDDETLIPLYLKETVDDEDGEVMVVRKAEAALPPAPVHKPVYRVSFTFDSYL